MAGTSMKLDGRFRKQAKGVFEKYNFEVGVLRNGEHKDALPAKKGLKNFAGGPARRVGAKSSKSIQDVSKSLRRITGINFYTRPFRSRANRDILRLFKHFFDFCAGRGERRRVENALQAVVRNPILRGDYGANSEATTKIKGFDRLMIDTGQLFKAIRARAVRRSV